MRAPHRGSRRFSWIGLLAADLLAVALALALALILLSIFRHERIGGDFSVWWRVEGETQSLAFVLLGLYSCLRFWGLGHYELRLPFWDELRSILKVLSGAGLLNVLVVVLLHGSLSRFLWPISWALVLCFIPLIRGLVRRCLMHADLWNLPVVILGEGTNAMAAWRALNSEARLGFAVQFFVRLHGGAPSTELPVTSMEMDEKQLLAWLDEHAGTQVVIALEAGEMERHAPLVERLALSRRDLFLVPPVSGLPLVGLVPRHFFRQEVLMLAVRNNLGSFPRRVLKRGFDVLGALAGLLILAPLFAILIWRIRRDGGMALFGQQRVGRGGRAFNCLKFRSMVPDSTRVLAQLLQCDAKIMDEWRTSHKLKQDPRVTSVGRFLRSSSLDELPQLWNVLRGDMSLVGPRPVVEEELLLYGDKADLYQQVRPGMSGLWQVSGRNDTSYAERVALDAWYIKNWSLWYDIAIICKTVGVVLSRKGVY